MFRFIALFFVAVSLSACVTPTTIITPLNVKDQGVRNIQSVSVSYSDLSKDNIIAADQGLKETQEEKKAEQHARYLPLKETLRNIVKERLETRDSDGPLAANIEIEIDNLKLANPMKAFLVGDTDQLAGTVRIYDPRTNVLLTEFYTDVLKGAGGIVGVVTRGGMRENLSLQFADIIGDHLGYPKTSAAPQPDRDESR